MRAYRIVAPAGLPVTVDECKRDLRMSGVSDHDDLILSLIEAATEYCDGLDGVLSRPLMTQTWRITDDRMRPRWDLPLSPVQSVAAIRYYDGANTLQTLADGSFRLISAPDGAHLEVVQGVTLPSVYSRADAVQIDAVCGYGDATDVPTPIRAAIRILVGHWFNNAAVITNSPNMYTVPHAFDAIVANYRARVAG